MSTTYTGDGTATQSPALKPGPGVNPVITLPADGDSLSASSVIQMVKEPADCIAFLNSNLQDIFAEQWLVTAAALTTTATPITGTIWNYTKSGTTAGVAINNPTSTCASRSASFTATDGTSLLATAVPLLYPNTNSRVCLECNIKFTWASGSPATVNFGLSSTADQTGYIISIVSAATWQVYVGATPYDTGVGEVSGDTVQFKILWDSIADTIKIYANGTLVQTAVSGMPSLSLLYLVGYMTNASAALNTATISELRLSWSR